MIENNKNICINEHGAVQIVEASFVFPIMFIILFFLIYMGNAHYIKAQVEAVTHTYALKGAAYCSDPLLETIKETGNVPTPDEFKSEPYRYLFTEKLSDIANEISKSVEEEISGSSVSFFKNMLPLLKTPTSNIAKFNNYIVYSTFSVEVEYVIQFPIKMLGVDTAPLLTIKSRAEVPVNDTAEFIRNTDMVVDLISGTKIGNNIAGIFKKVNDFISNFSKK